MRTPFDKTALPSDGKAYPMKSSTSKLRFVGRRRKRLNGVSHAANTSVLSRRYVNWALHCYRGRFNGASLTVHQAAIAHVELVKEVFLRDIDPRME